MAKIFETQMTPVMTCVAVTCDRCGVTHDDRMETQEFLSWSMSCGYGNNTFGDLNRVDLDLCQDCTKEVLGQWIRVTDYRAIHDDEDEEAEQD